MNNPSRTSEGFIGPIPAGQYYIDMKDFSDPGFIGEWARYIRSWADWGDWRVPIKPQPWNKTKRDGFYLHGGKWPGSAGCIDIGGGFNGSPVTDQMRTELKRDPDGIIEVDVYPSQNTDPVRSKSRSRRM